MTSQILRISILQGAFLPVPPLLGGAVEKQWFVLGKEFCAQGHEVTHVSRSFTGLPTREIIDGVKHWRIGGASTPKAILLRKFRDLAYTLRAIRAMPPSDVIVTNTFWAPFIFPALRNGRVVVDFSRMPKGQARVYPRQISIRVPSSAVARRIQMERPSPEGDLWVIPNALTSPAGPVNLEAKQKRVLYAGRIHPEKGLELLLKAFLGLPEEMKEAWKLDFVGPSETKEGGGGRHFQEQLAAKFRHPSIRWHGPVHDTDALDRFYSESAIFCYPSIAEHGETFGSAPLEAMAWGCATVVSALDCFLDFINPGENGMAFDHRSSVAVGLLTDSLRQLMVSNDLRHRIGSGALRVRMTHSLGHISALYLDRFQEFMRRGQ